MTHSLCKLLKQSKLSFKRIFNIIMKSKIVFLTIDFPFDVKLDASLLAVINCKSLLYCPIYSWLRWNTTRIEHKIWLSVNVKDTFQLKSFHRILMIDRKGILLPSTVKPQNVSNSWPCNQTLKTPHLLRLRKKMQNAWGHFSPKLHNDGGCMCWRFSWTLGLITV